MQLNPGSCVLHSWPIRNSQWMIETILSMPPKHPKTSKACPPPQQLKLTAQSEKDSTALQ